MPANSNIGFQWPRTNKFSGPQGSDNPGQQTCPNCRSVVTPHPTNGIGNRQGNNKANNVLTSAGYSCPKCGHSFSWTKSTGKAGGPVQSGATNSNTAADM
jgi:ssDNA-binding Zn-finger/Zn-ribbon topoisomerase 1